MKIVTFYELCEMPEGTVFQSYAPHMLGEPMVFGGARRDGEGKFVDFLEAPLFPSADFGRVFSSDEPPLPDGSPIDPNKLYISTPSGFSGWGYYDFDAMFLVHEQEDRERIAQWLLFPPLAAKQMNDDAHAIIEVEE